MPQANTFDSRLFQAEWWVENIPRTGWRKEQGTLRTLAEMRAWLKWTQMKMLRRLPDLPVQGVVEITHVEKGDLTDEQAMFLGGYKSDDTEGMARLFGAVYSLKRVKHDRLDPSI